MPTYTFNHIHHETKDVDGAVAWYKKLFNAASDEPFERGGATWVPVHIGATQITVTDREFTDMELGRTRATTTSPSTLTTSTKPSPISRRTASISGWARSSSKTGCASSSSTAPTTSKSN